MNELNNIVDPEPRILDNYYKFKHKATLKAPKRPLENPMDLPEEL